MLSSPQCLTARSPSPTPAAAALWCDGRLVILCGLEELPRVGYRFEAHDELWRVVEDRESLICERVGNNDSHLVTSSRRRQLTGVHCWETSSKASPATPPRRGASFFIPSVCREV